MRPTILSSIPVTLPVQELQGRLRIREGSDQAAELQQMIREAEAIGRPRAVCGVAYIDAREGDHLVMDGVRFSSHILAVNLEPVNRVFPYVATCGTELDAWAARFHDVLYRYWSEAIREAAMRLAFSAVEDHLRDTYGVGETARMNPGSLEDWPIQQQSQLFQLLGNPEESIGVRLTESYLMLPTKSVSGIRFTSASTWENCMLCPRPVCPNRRAKYAPDLLETRFSQPPEYLS